MRRNCYKYTIFKNFSRFFRQKTLFFSFFYINSSTLCKKICRTLQKVLYYLNIFVIIFNNFIQGVFFYVVGDE